MINTNLPAMLHRLRDIAFEISKIAIFSYPWDDLRDIFRECQRMAKVPNSVEILSKILTHSPCHSPCVASPVRKPTRDAQGSADQSMKKPILVSLILLNEPLKALMLVASTGRWSS